MHDGRGERQRGAHRGEGGAQEQLGVFFKAPMTREPGTPEHDFFRQQHALMNWLTHTN